MNTRYLSRIGTLQLQSTLTFKPKFRSTTAFKYRTKKALNFKDELDNVRIRKRRSPSSKEPESSSNINRMLASDAFKYRTLRYNIDSGDSKSTTVRFHLCGENKDGNLEKVDRSITFDFRRSRPLRNTVILRQAASTLSRFLERWPHTLDFSSRDKKILVDVALEHITSQVSKIYPTIEFGPPKSIYGSRVTGIDPDSGERYRISVAVRPKNITNFDVPETPKTERFTFRETSRFHPQTAKDATQKRVPKKRVPVSPISDEDTSNEGRKGKAAIKILQLVLWKYHSKILRPSDVQYAIEETILKYAARTKGSRGPYEGELLYRLFYNRVGEYDFRPSCAVSRDTFPMLPPITLVGSQAQSTLHVGDTIISTWISTGDLKKAWLMGWETAQTVNEEAKAARKNTDDKDRANWKVSNKPLNIRTLLRR